MAYVWWQEESTTIASADTSRSVKNIKNSLFPLSFFISEKLTPPLQSDITQSFATEQPDNMKYYPSCIQAAEVRHPTYFWDFLNILFSLIWCSTVLSLQIPSRLTDNCGQTAARWSIHSLLFSPQLHTRRTDSGQQKEEFGSAPKRLWSALGSGKRGPNWGPRWQAPKVMWGQNGTWSAYSAGWFSPHSRLMPPSSFFL